MSTPAAPEPPAPEAPPEPPSLLIPGHIPFPPAREGEMAEPTVQIAQPPPLYPPLPRGLKPFTDATPEELRLVRLSRAIRGFFRASAYHHGDRDDELERRAREGDVSRWRDEEASGTSSDEDDERGDKDDEDAIDERWIRSMRRAFTLEDLKVTDERIVPREILEAAFGARANAPNGKGKKRAANDASASGGDKKRGKANEDGERDDQGATASTKQRKGDISRLERLARLEESSAAKELDGDAVEGKSRGRLQSRASDRQRRARSPSKNARAGDEDDDEADEDAVDRAADDDDELDSDDDYARAAGFNDDDGYDDDIADHADTEAFY